MGCSSSSSAGHVKSAFKEVKAKSVDAVVSKISTKKSQIKRKASFRGLNADRHGIDAYVISALDCGDKNHDGVLNAKEFKRVMKRMFIPISLKRGTC